MKLITMAHMGEAQAIIQDFAMKKVGDQLFTHDLFELLLTGEGPFEAQGLTALQLGKKSYEKVINLGFAGSFNTSFAKGEILGVRTHYLAIENKPAFKTYSSALGSTTDCVTSFKRIGSTADAQILQGLGELVDRESWGVAQASKFAGVPFESYKIISDFADEKSCEVVRETANDYSEKLSQLVQGLLTQTAGRAKESLSFPELYITHAHGLKLRSLLDKLSRDQEKSPEAFGKEILQTIQFPEKASPKERTQIFISALERKFDPFKDSVERLLSAWKAPFLKHGIQLQTDPSLESRTVKLQFEVRSDQELQDKLSLLQSLSLKPLEDLRRGAFRVE